jgi:ABC-type lipoprotein export system ATPase subunit
MLDGDNNKLSISESVLTESLLTVDEWNDASKKPEERTEYVKALKDINIEIYSATFSMILGDIGSGKSSFLLSILNEMKASKNSLV